MHDYSVYGGWLRSAIPIPELRPREPQHAEDGPGAQWEFEVASGGAPALVAGQATGRDELTTGVFAEVIRAPGVVRVVFDDTGVFDVFDGGRVRWYPKDGSVPDVARADLVGRVLPLTLHDRGLTSLHGSAVVIAGRALAFLAPKNHGKSTLALALIEHHAARLLSDDTLIVTPETAIAHPGVLSVRLWEQTAQRFARLGDGRPVLSEKRIFEELPSEWLAHDAVPLAAVYALVPAAPESADAVRREALDGPGATIALIQYQKLGALLGGSDAARVFDHAASLAARIPVYRLHIARDLARLGHVTESLVRWHTA
ncbi:MAG: hypothetical protein ACT4P6_18890 [Gemmatimonadaceae bacterium]